jgi:hypothetical protein
MILSIVEVVFFHINIPNKKNHFFYTQYTHRKRTLPVSKSLPQERSYLVRQPERARQVLELVQDTHVLAHLIGLKPRLFGSVGRVLDAVVLVLGRGLHCVILATHVRRWTPAPTPARTYLFATALG